MVRSLIFLLLCSLGTMVRGMEEEQGHEIHADNLEEYLMGPSDVGGIRQVLYAWYQNNLGAMFNVAFVNTLLDRMLAPNNPAGQLEARRLVDAIQKGKDGTVDPNKSLPMPVALQTHSDSNPLGVGTYQQQMITLWMKELEIQKQAFDDDTRLTEERNAETKRNNQAMEQLTKETKDIAIEVKDEQSRHNKMAEGHALLTRRIQWCGNGISCCGLLAAGCGTLVSAVFGPLILWYVMTNNA